MKLERIKKAVQVYQTMNRSYSILNTSTVQGDYATFTGFKQP